MYPRSSLGSHWISHQHFDLFRFTCSPASCRLRLRVLRLGVFQSNLPCRLQSSELGANYSPARVTNIRTVFIYLVLLSQHLSFTSNKSSHQFHSSLSLKEGSNHSRLHTLQLPFASTQPLKSKHTTTKSSKNFLS